MELFNNTAESLVNKFEPYRAARRHPMFHHMMGLASRSILNLGLAATSYSISEFIKPQMFQLTIGMYDYSVTVDSLLDEPTTAISKAFLLAAGLVLFNGLSDLILSQTNFGMQRTHDQILRSEFPNELQGEIPQNGHFLSTIKQQILSSLFPRKKVQDNFFNRFNPPSNGIIDLMINRVLK